MKVEQTDARFLNVHPSSANTTSHPGESPRDLNGRGVFYSDLTSTGDTVQVMEKNTSIRSAATPALFLLCMLFSLTISAQEEWTDKALPLGDASKPLYQKAWGGTVIAWPVGDINRVRITSVDELKEQLEYDYQRKINEIKISEIKTGSRFFWIGIIITIASVVAHCITSLPQVQRICEWCMIGGGGCSVSGLMIKKVAEYQDWIAWGIGFIILGAIAYKVRGFSISHKFTKKDIGNTNGTDQD